MTFNARLSALLLLGVSFAPLALSGQTIDAFYAGSYNFRSLGVVPDLPTQYGGFAFKAGDPNTLLIGGSANTPQALIYSIGVVRDTNKHVIGFTNTVAPFASASTPGGGGIDGGLAYGPSNVLFFTSYNDNYLSQIKPGETNPAVQFNLNGAGVAPSVGSLVFVPAGFPGAGRLKLLSYDSETWYDTSITAQTNGTFAVAQVSKSVSLPLAGPEGAIYVAGGNPGFGRDSVLISEYGAGEVAAYGIDANGDPVPSTRRTFMRELQGAEGAAVDPLTGDFLFCTFGGDPKVLVVSGFTVNPLNVRPVVKVTSPAEGTQLREPATITIAVDATDSDGTISTVEIFAGANRLALVTNAPYRFVWSGVIAGSYAISAKATDNGNGTTVSDFVNVTVTPTVNNPPTISITSPVSSTSIAAGSDLPISVTAADSDGQVTKVEYFAGSTKLGESAASPFGFIWRNVPAGSYVLTAVATDNGGATTTSAAVNITAATSSTGKITGANQAGGFLLTIPTQPNRTYGIEASTNFLTWVRLTNMASGSSLSIQFLDTSKVKYEFYRVVDVAVVPPVTTLKLTGSKQANGFLLSLSTATNQTYAIEASTNLLTWTRLTNMPSGSSTNIQYLDPSGTAAQFRARYYRAQGL